MVTGIIWLNLWKGLSKEKSSAGFWTQTEWGDSVDWQAAFMQWWNWMSAHQRISNHIFEFSKASHMRIRGCAMFETCRAKLKGKRAVHYWNDSAQRFSLGVFESLCLKLKCFTLKELVSREFYCMFATLFWLSVALTVKPTFIIT